MKNLVDKIELKEKVKILLIKNGRPTAVSTWKVIRSSDLPL